MPIPATALLVEFSARASEASPPHASFAAVPGRSEADVEAAFERGREEGLAAGRDELALRLEEARSEFEARLGEARAAWVAEEGARLGKQMEAAISALESRIGDAVAETLRPFVGEAVRNEAVAALAGALKPFLTGEQGRLSVRGPADLLEALQERLGAYSAFLTFDASDEVDLSVRVGSTEIATQLEPWLERIKEQRA